MNESLPILDCRTCGRCCLDVGVPPYRLPELFGVPKRLRSALLRIVERLAVDPRRGPCIALDRSTNRCRIYKHRPAVCRDLEVGGHQCSVYRRRFA